MSDRQGADEPEATGDLEQHILGEERVYNAAQLAADTGVDLEKARRLWRALGFPEHGGATAFTRSDAQALSTLVGLVDSGLIDFDLAVHLTRAVGQTMARLSDWEVSALLTRVLELAREQSGDSDSGAGDQLAIGLRMIDEFSEPFEKLLLYVWRRHLAAAVARIEALGAREEDLHTTRLTVGFADIVQFTALSNELSEERIGDLVELFEARCADVVASRRGRVIKSIGDSVLFVHEDPIAAYEIAEGVIAVIGRDSRMPDVRVGLASGLVVLRLGDVFGPPVNMAARLTAVARRNRVIVDAATAGMLPEDQFETRRLPARPVRGFGLVEPVAVRRN
ncbi:adenylate/guanylate cyclase domain-containing protein [Nocardioides halotolerans]|uniref:adenylate/guanylate cyclase domain-containing protein n=1 Tax=Nocardioides halotolerans TaxID=433660 RepID=UPI00040B5AF9|nr:adenylate/guanylate cyclase domain-containing protein [Nocardioides halotolerans]